MRYEWLQVPNDMLRVRARTLANLLTAATGRKVSRGDALTLVLDLWDWVVSQVNEDAEDLDAEFERCAVLPYERAEALLPEALGWPDKHAMPLMQALCDKHVGVMAVEGERLRVLGIRERYSRLAKQQGDSRGRARAAYLAKANGWTHKPGVGYVSPTGEVAESWRDLLERLGGAK